MKPLKFIIEYEINAEVSDIVFIRQSLIDLISKNIKFDINSSESIKVKTVDFRVLCDEAFFE